MSELRAGAASVDITPPLCGRWQPLIAEGIDTPLAASALVIANEENAVAFVGLDLIAITADYVNRARDIIRA